jgi:hypothetical protein
VRVRVCVWGGAGGRINANLDGGSRIGGQQHACRPERERERKGCVEGGWAGD